MELKYSYDNMKNFDKRVAVESKKAKDLSIAMDKVRQQLDLERKAYCETLAKQLLVYESNKSMHDPEFQKIITLLKNKIDALDGEYRKAINHIAEVPYSALGSLPKKYESCKKLIKTGDKNPAGFQKIKDFEYDRIETFHLAMLHFMNAQMYLHAKALEIFSELYDTLGAHQGPQAKLPIKQAISNTKAGGAAAGKPPTGPAAGAQ